MSGTDKALAGVAAALALAQITRSPEEALPFLLRVMEQKGDREIDWNWVQRNAAGALGELRLATPETVKALIRSAKKGHYEAVVALGALGPAAREAVPHLREMLCGPGLDWQDAKVVEALFRITRDWSAVRPYLVSALALAPPNGSRSEATELLGVVGKGQPEAVRMLIQVSRGRNGRAQFQAIRSLGRLGPEAKAALPQLERLVTAADSDTRRAARESLRAIAR